MTNNQPIDHWTPQAYSASASFVPALITKIVQYLDPQPLDLILDLGCGDGLLTSHIASRCRTVIGLDSSPSLISAAIASYSSIENLFFELQDCRYLHQWPEYHKGLYDKIFSNAALHWILRDPNTRRSVLRDVIRKLKSGGTFVFEMGGAGNVAEVHTALIAAVVRQGLSVEEARDVSPWFFPSQKLMGRMLEEVGFRVEEHEVEYRPTKLTEDREGGLEGWVRLMGRQFLEALDAEEKKEAAVRDVCEVLNTVITHEEDGSMWLGYVRLRVLARKP
ncbi:MAG: hypothetical protein LQ342_007517 [Letrouitia transgressa]|nr:MAG: hypothetical protein LQ342_007517 [Letrouitia transgressa]